MLLNKAYKISHTHQGNGTKLNQAALDETMMLAFRILEHERKKTDYLAKSAHAGFRSKEYMHHVVMTKYRRDWRENGGCLSHACGYLASKAHGRAVKEHATGIELEQPKYMKPCSAMCNANMGNPCTAIYTKDVRQRIDYLPKELETVREQVCTVLRNRNCRNDLLCTYHGQSIADVMPNVTTAPTQVPTLVPKTPVPTVIPTSHPTYWLFNKKINPDVAKWLAHEPTSTPTSAPSKPGVKAINPTLCFENCCNAMLASSAKVAEDAFEHPLPACARTMGVSSLDDLHLMRLRPPQSGYTVMIGGACAKLPISAKPLPANAAGGLSLPPGLFKLTNKPTPFPTTAPTHRGDLAFYQNPEELQLDNFCTCVQRCIRGSHLNPIASFTHTPAPSSLPTVSPTSLRQGFSDAEHSLVPYLGKGLTQKLKRADESGKVLLVLVLFVT
jgi:hypothetical protein